MSDAGGSAGHDHGPSSDGPPERPGETSAARTTSADEAAAPANGPAASKHPSTAAEEAGGGESDVAGPICDICGAAMFERHCKILCPVCGYQRDCSDP